MADRFAAIDTDGDGVIEEQEARAALERVFTRTDADGSGFITPAEYSGFHLPGRAEPDRKPFEEVDLDGDGRIERSEYLKVGMMRLAATDLDDRAGISLSEHRAFARRSAPPGRGRRWCGQGHDALELSLDARVSRRVAERRRHR